MQRWLHHADHLELDQYLYSMQMWSHPSASFTYYIEALHLLCNCGHTLLLIHKVIDGFSYNNEDWYCVILYTAAWTHGQCSSGYTQMILHSSLPPQYQESGFQDDNPESLAIAVITPEWLNMWPIYLLHVRALPVPYTHLTLPTIYPV